MLLKKTAKAASFVKVYPFQFVMDLDWCLAWILYFDIVAILLQTVRTKLNQGYTSWSFLAIQETSKNVCTK